MGGASAPLWVTIMLGVLAVVGTILGAWGGQWIAARRDDRRWEREIAREDVRWQRERERLAVQYSHEASLHWSERRIGAYRDYVAEFGKLRDLFDKIKSLPRESLHDESWKRQVRSQSDHLIKSWSAIQFVASEDVRDVAAGVYGTCFQLSHDYFIADTARSFYKALSSMEKASEMLKLSRETEGVDSEELAALINKVDKVIPKHLEEYYEPYRNYVDDLLMPLLEKAKEQRRELIEIVRAELGVQALP